MTSKAKYRVANPNSIPKGIRIIAAVNPADDKDLREWYEGDTFTPPPWFNATMVKGWVEKGYLEVV